MRASALLGWRAGRVPVHALRSRDPGLHRQIRAAASSIALNFAEGSRRQGQDRRHHYRVAAETAAALRVAEAWGNLPEVAVREPLEILDRLLATLWRLGA